MKIILQKDVRGLGKIGGILTVANGYARNYLFPQKLAKLADAAALSELAQKAKNEELYVQKRQRDAYALAKKLLNTRLIFALPATERGHLYAGLKPGEILAKLKLKEAKLVDYENLKEIGEYRVKVELMPKLQTEITIVIKNA